MPIKLTSLKLKIAAWLDDRHPEYCWATLVCWAYGYHSTWEVFGWERLGSPFIANNQTCKNLGVISYCGKCDIP